jgi:cell division protein FtsW
MVLQSKQLKKRGDLLLLSAALSLTIIGWIMGYSASAVMAWKNYHDPYLFLKKRFFHIIIGLLPLVLAMKLNYQYLRKITYPLLFISITLLLLLLVSPLGKEVCNARRWLTLGIISFQPAELAKLSLVMYLAHSFAKRTERLKEFSYGYLPNFIILGLFSGLIFLQPDLGTAVLLLLVGWLICFIAGIRIIHLGYSVLFCLPFILIALIQTEFRRQRLFAFLNPWGDALNSGYQITQSFLALGNGGWWGLGLGQGKQKLFYLPESHTDFIFAIIGEELGFIGALGIIVLLGIIIYRGFRIASCFPDIYGNLLASGIILLLAIQSAINLGVVVGLLPIKGLPLPFISWGGSSLIINMVGIGILWNLSQQVEGWS